MNTDENDETFELFDPEDLQAQTAALKDDEIYVAERAADPRECPKRIAMFQQCVRERRLKVARLRKLQRASHAVAERAKLTRAKVGRRKAAATPRPRQPRRVRYAAAKAAADGDSISEPAGLAAALAAASVGLPVFPCGPDKRPLCKWSAASTTDPDALAKVFAKHPQATFGIDLGKAGLSVVDLDKKDGKDGIAAFAALCDQHGYPDNAPVVRTPSSGLHFVFRTPPGVRLKNSVSRVADGIDVRAAGGYVIGVGSMLPDGRRYKIEPGAPDLLDSFASDAIPEMPSWLVEKILAADQNPCSAKPIPDPIERTTAPANTCERGRAYARRALEENARALAAQGAGGRNDLLNSKAYRMARMGARGWISRAEVESAFYAACQSNGLWREDPNACRATFDSGWTGGFAKPLGDIEDRHDGEPPTTRLDLILPGGGASDGQGVKEDRSPTPDPLAGFIFDGDAPLEPPPMLVKKLVPLDGICFVGGQSGAGKTFVAVDLAVAIASGEPFFDHKVAERVGVAICAAEGASTIGNRVMVARNHKAHGEILPIAWLGAVPNLADEKQVREIIERLKALDARFRAEHGVRLGAIICDTLAASFSLADENDNAEAAKAIRAMKVMSDALGAVVVPVHHFGKAIDTGLRGASAWRAGCDSVLSVLADRCQITGRCSNRRLALTKSRVGEEGWVAPFDLHFVPLGVDGDGDEFGACYIEPGQASADILSSAPKAKQQPRVAEVFLQSFGVLVGDKGEQVRPFGAEGGEVLAVDREAIREEFYRFWAADGESEEARAAARRKAFKRGEDWLLKARRISSYDVGNRHMVWLLGEGAGQ